jgi:hypothetical protein
MGRHPTGENQTNTRTVFNDLFEAHGRVDVLAERLGDRRLMWSLSRFVALPPITAPPHRDVPLAVQMGRYACHGVGPDEFYAASRSNSRTTDVACQSPPRGVRMPRRFSSSAMSRTLVIPLVRTYATMALWERRERSIARLDHLKLLRDDHAMSSGHHGRTEEAKALRERYGLAARENPKYP